MPAAWAEELLLESFEGCLLVERGLAPGTVRGYVGHARRFLACLEVAGGLCSVTAAEVTSVVLRESAAVSVATTQNFVAGLKAFLRFCFVGGLVALDLSGAALAITGRRRSSLPRGIGAAEAKALLVSCDRRSALGRRDYALLVVLLRLGLRRSEVAGLRLEDIDWRAGEVVVRGKGAREDRLPLPADVGGTIAAYLRSASTSAWSVPTRSTGASGICQEGPSRQSGKIGGRLLRVYVAISLTHRREPPHAVNSAAPVLVISDASTIADADPARPQQSGSWTVSCCISNVAASRAPPGFSRLGRASES